MEQLWLKLVARNPKLGSGETPYRGHIVVHRQMCYTCITYVVYMCNMCVRHM